MKDEALRQLRKPRFAPFFLKVEREPVPQTKRAFADCHLVKRVLRGKPAYRADVCVVITPVREVEDDEIPSRLSTRCDFRK